MPKAARLKGIDGLVLTTMVFAALRCFFELCPCVSIFLWCPLFFFSPIKSARRRRLSPFLSKAKLSSQSCAVAAECSKIASNGPFIIDTTRSCSFRFENDQNKIASLIMRRGYFAEIEDWVSRQLSCSWLSLLAIYLRLAAPAPAAGRTGTNRGCAWPHTAFSAPCYPSVVSGRRYPIPLRLGQPPAGGPPSRPARISVGRLSFIAVDGRNSQCFGLRSFRWCVGPGHKHP